jgi:hypothetical protein
VLETASDKRLVADQVRFVCCRRCVSASAGDDSGYGLGRIFEALADLPGRGGLRPLAIITDEAEVDPRSINLS